MTKKDNILYFNNLSRFPHLIHGFSTREFGSIRPVGHPESLKRFVGELKGENSIVRMHQVHSKNVKWVGAMDAGQTIDEVDGILSSDKGVFLSVVTADCVPVLLYDKAKHVVGAVHAGWRGVYKEIVKEAVGEMIGKGSKPEAIMVGIGPAIRSCCYEVSKEHAEMFTAKFSKYADIVSARDKKFFLNLPLLVKYQLRSLGIPDTTIEDAEICTAESKELYSRRREGEGFGEFVGVIGKI